MKKRTNIILAVAALVLITVGSVGAASSYRQTQKQITTFEKKLSVSDQVKLNLSAFRYIELRSSNDANIHFEVSQLNKSTNTINLNQTGNQISVTWQTSTNNSLKNVPLPENFLRNFSGNFYENRQLTVFVPEKVQSLEIAAPKSHVLIGDLTFKNLTLTKASATNLDRLAVDNLIVAPGVKKLETSGSDFKTIATNGPLSELILKKSNVETATLRANSGAIIGTTIKKADLQLTRSDDTTNEFSFNKAKIDQLHIAGSTEFLNFIEVEAPVSVDLQRGDIYYATKTFKQDISLATKHDNIKIAQESALKNATITFAAAQKMGSLQKKNSPYTVGRGTPKIELTAQLGKISLLNNQEDLLIDDEDYYDDDDYEQDNMMVIHEDMMADMHDEMMSDDD